ncbi:MAG: hypothetical protein EAZ06_09615 [Cytophagales bacterium]|nr:MAG: hypothetical protein EAZ06_09615 [Cytophagales bacterium]
MNRFFDDFFCKRYFEIIAPACVPQAVGARFVCYNIGLWDTSEGVKPIFYHFELIYKIFTLTIFIYLLQKKYTIFTLK